MLGYSFRILNHFKAVVSPIVPPCPGWHPARVDWRVFLWILNCWPYSVKNILLVLLVIMHLCMYKAVSKCSGSHLATMRSRDRQREIDGAKWASVRLGWRSNPICQCISTSHECCTYRLTTQISKQQTLDWLQPFVCILKFIIHISQSIT